MTKSIKAIKKSNLKGMFSNTVNEVVIYPKYYLYGYSVEKSDKPQFITPPTDDVIYKVCNIGGIDYTLPFLPPDNPYFNKALKKTSNITPQKKLDYRYSRFKRARRNTIDIIKTNILQWSKYPQFITLTYRHLETNLDTAFYDWSLFIKRLNYHFNKTLRYIAVVEFQDRGAIHFHSIFFDIPFEHNIVTKTLNPSWSDNGRITQSTIKDVQDERIHFYISKYISKFNKNDNRLDNRKCFFTSKNLIKPLYIRSPYNVDNYILQNDLICVHTVHSDNGFIIKKYKKRL